MTDLDGLAYRATYLEGALEALVDLMTEVIAYDVESVRALDPADPAARLARDRVAAWRGGIKGWRDAVARLKPQMPTPPLAYVQGGDWISGKFHEALL